MKRILALCINLTITLLIIKIPAFTVSASVQAKMDYTFALKTIRYLNISVANFGSESVKVEFDKIRKLFKQASENYYGRNYLKSFNQFRKVKSELILLSRKMAKVYLDRTKLILDEVAIESHEIILDYSKEGALAEFFKHPYDPFNDVKTYDPTKYHYFHDREKIETYLDNGFKNFHAAKKIFDGPDLNYLLTKKNVPSKSLNYIIEQYIITINLCRQAKTLGIAIYKIKYMEKMETIISKYNIHSKRLYPVLDERIPDRYKIDASDNRNLIHSVEIKKVQNNKKIP